VAAGGASRWWLHVSLTALDAALRARGSRLIVRRGTSTAEVLERVVSDSREPRGLAACAHTPRARLSGRRRGCAPIARYRIRNIRFALAGGSVGHPPPPSIPGLLRLLAHRPSPGPRPQVYSCTTASAAALDLARLRATRLPVPSAHSRLGGRLTRNLAARRSRRDPGPANIHGRFISRYADQRDVPGADHTSRLSPYLHFGELSVEHLWHTLAQLDFAAEQRSAELLRSKLGWREFAHYVLFHLIGARWFWDTLVDADLANNTLGWQWSAGCGFDAAPFTRVFNPTLQAERFDAEGVYIRRYVPELANLAAPYIHRPFEAPPFVLAEAGVRLGKTYPYPIVDHAAARRRALAAFAARRTV
jgi:deoxyribodipyrimidine photolyase